MGEGMRAVLVLAPIGRHGTVSNFRQGGELSSQGGTGGFRHNCAAAGGPAGLKMIEWAVAVERGQRLKEGWQGAMQWKGKKKKQCE